MRRISVRSAAAEVRNALVTQPLVGDDRAPLGDLDKGEIRRYS